MTLSTEHAVGNDCTGSSGDANRVLTLSNLELTSEDDFMVFVNGLSLSPTTEYTVSHLAANSTVTFLNVLFDDQNIIVQYNSSITVTSTNYCTATEVGAYLQITISGSSNPSTTQVNSLIAMNEDLIDYETGHAWREKTVSNETHHIDKPSYLIEDGLQVFLDHRKIKTLDTSEGDKIEVWDGSSYTDYVASKSETRNGDFWLDYEQGILFLNDLPITWPRYFGLKATYRYGETTVPNDIKKACILLSAADVLQADDRSVLLPEGSSNIPISDKANKFREEAEKIIARHKETAVASH